VILRIRQQRRNRLAHLSFTGNRTRRVHRRHRGRRVRKREAQRRLDRQVGFGGKPVFDIQSVSLAAILEPLVGPSSNRLN